MTTTRILTLLMLVSSGAVGAEPTASTTARFSVNVDLGDDIGQGFGSLIEVKDRDGRVVAGAGFHDVYNTHFRTDRHVLQFFARPEEGDEEFTIERLPHPDLDCGVYLFDFDGQVYCFSSARGDAVRRWDEAGGDWVDELPPHAPGFRFGDGVMRVGQGQLTFAENAAWYDDQMILSPPPEGRYHHFYYANGQLCFYHRVEGDRPGTEIYACAWTPGDGPIDLNSAVRLPTTFEVETPFAWGQWQDELLTVSNMGGVYVFADDRWTTVLEPDDKTSYQVYSMLRWHDRLLLAQYPTGNMFEYRGSGEVPRRLEGWPPVMPGVSTGARECQTLGIYRGDLLAGVWPWAELWRRDRDAERWSLLGRMFTHPPATDAFTHPYETEADAQGLVLNHWGQRITGMVPQCDSLLLSTSSKGTAEWKDEYTFLSDEQRREYGSVLRLTMPGSLAAPIVWQNRPIKFDFIIEPGRLSIEQDGEVLATAELPKDFALDLSEVETNWGNGVHGPLSGNLLEHSQTIEQVQTSR